LFLKKNRYQLWADNGFDVFMLADLGHYQPFAPQQLIIMPLTSTRIRLIRLLMAKLLFIMIQSDGFNAPG
jgi:hypothetical protein